MGFANSPATRTALASHGIRVSGYRWQWGLGLKGGTFPPHYHQNGEHAPTADSFEAQPGEDVNGDTCMCALVPVYRDEAGRFARPGLEPVFTPPVVAALQSPPEIDWSPLVAALSEQRHTTFDVRIPDGAIIVNLPKYDIRPADVVVNVPKGETPNVTVTPALAATGK